MKISTLVLVASFLPIAACSGDGQATADQDNTPLGPPPPPPPAGETFEQMKMRLESEKPFFMQRQLALLAARYNLANQPGTATMTRGKPVQSGIRVKLPTGVTFNQLSQMTPAQIKAAGLFPDGFKPLPHPRHLEGGMLFPHFEIEEVLAQTGRDLERFDLEFDLPDHVLPEFPAPIFLTTRPELGDVSQGQLVTTHNFFRLFKDVLNPKDLDGLRLLVFPFAQQQFNLIDDRRSCDPQLGVACFDCHQNGHTNAATHLVGDIRPQEHRNRIDTPSLRGVHLQRLFGSQRSLMSIEDFTEFEQRAAYFDGDIDKAALKGINPLDRASQVQHMAELQKLLAFPPAPKLDVFGRLKPSATAAERRGQALFNGKARCIECHDGPHFSDNNAHDLALERFFDEEVINDMVANGDGPIKTFPLRGIKDSPPYLHDGRLITLEDTIEFFNLVLGVKLTNAEKADLLAYLLVL
ncbi:MAG: cytochrome B6 [Myxococcota bacterium]|nr:cytochrome B6 [Deltaproteobacteria bacterium]MDQ3336649.1 cytochrome B6 [Myxococcota bacterium]